MAVGFAALDKRIIRDTETLHDFLWHGEKKDETSLTGKLADFLEPKGYMDSGQFKRLLNAVYEFGVNWNAVASKPEQSLAARTSIEGAGWCLLTSVSIRELLGVPPKFSTNDFADIIE